MGIPHLAHQLQPHGTKVVLVRDPAGQIPAVIDGPSLAYHCFYVCLARRGGARNTFEAAPSYKELGEAAISWLDQIEQFGLKVYVSIKRIPFTDLNIAEFVPGLVKSVHASKSDVLSLASLSARLKSLPASPFLVPAVIEAILASRYKEVTSVIPGEADAYCAQSARSLGGTIFTSDSDLLVHDLGEAGKVILFKDIEGIHLPSKGKCLKTQQYQPSMIATKFGLPNLVRLAWFMSEDNHRSFIEATVLAKERNPTSKEFTDFKEQYASLPVLSTLANEYLTHSERPVFKLLSQLDPRISELIHQITMSHSKANEDRSLDMYLPFLIDDPTRTSAWRVGADIRKLAYSVLRLLDLNVLSVDEYERKGTRVSNTTANLSQPDELQTSASQILESLTAGQSETLSKVGMWRAVAVKIIVQSSLDAGQTSPAIVDLTRLISGSREGYISWSSIHASAQLQSVLYSFRLLLQTIQTVVAFLEEIQQRHESLPFLQGLLGLLKDLPDLSELLDDTTQASDKESEATNAYVSDLIQSLGVVEQPNESSSSKRKKKRKKKGDHVNETSPPAWRQNNPFGSLAQ